MGWKKVAKAEADRWREKDIKKIDVGRGIVAKRQCDGQQFSYRSHFIIIHFDINISLLFIFLEGRTNRTVCLHLELSTD